MLAIVLGATISAGPFSAVPLASLAGAAVAAAIVYRLATMQDRAMSTTVLLLAGVTLNSFFSALIMFVQYIADFAQVYRADALDHGRPRRRQLRADRGGAADAGDRLRDVRVAALVAEPAQRGRRCAPARGVDVGRTQRLAFVSASLATAARGVARRADRLHRHRRAASRAADRRRGPSTRPAGVGAVRRGVPRRVRSRRAHAARAARIPVGVITAMLGGPFFLWLLVRKG